MPRTRKKSDAQDGAPATPSADVFQLTLSGEQTIYQAAELHQQLHAALAGHAAIELDMSCVGELDCAIAQVLLWLRRESLRKGVALRFIAPSPASQDFIRLVGLQGELSLEEAAHGS
ncbi:MULTISPECIES: STAS domain-containing protein [Chromobacterium]|uniref:STAS domain-containing protein n=1 Tax=Chromobacterium TaxID=535 RepID=UPI0009D9E739|nr:MULTISPECIES: STAS domain-containing protein [Chromobacterium]QOZ82887.1 STAS domain-containing protein [Chromobacterium sp. Rain0013]UGA39207.1 STAS domain-containing protein [Chromobacterium haemolyticum]WON82961.1 STAS domain-containing protein [Chromobacterium haemolyticum]